MDNIQKEMALELSDIEMEDFSSQIIQDNKIPFDYNGEFYRVRMPLQIEQAEADNKRNIKQLEYMQEDGCILRKNLIKQLKEKNIIDFDALEEENQILIKQLQQVWYKLSTKFSDDVKNITELKTEVAILKAKLRAISIQITDLLSPALENKLEKFYIEYLTYLLTEKQNEEGNWIKVWATFTDFLQADTNLVNKAIGKLTWLLLNKKMA